MNIVSFKKILDTSFIKNFFVLLSGNSLARLIPVFTVPILARLYAPGDFGLQELFNTVLVFTNALSSGNYESAIILPKDDSIARTLRLIAISLASLFSILCFFVLYFIMDSFVAYAKNPSAESFVFLIPIMIVLNTFLQAQHQWAVRKELYRVLTTSNVVNTVFSAFFEIGFGLLGLTKTGMIMGSNLGNFSALLYITIAMKSIEKKEAGQMENPLTWRIIVKTMKEYSDFPKFQMIGTFFNRGVGYLPTLFFTHYFGPDLVGYYGMTRKLLGLPSTIIAQSAGNVFAGRAVREYNEKGECKATFKNTFLLLLIFAVPIFMGVFLIGPMLLPILLGPEWNNAGGILRATIPQYFFAFISSPFTRMFSITKKLKIGFLWQVGLFSLSLFTLFVGTRLFTPHMAILFFSFGYSVMYLINLVVTYRFAAKISEST